jgi:hypothetical protein
VEGCDGRVTARNRDSGGLEVSLYLTIAEPRNQSRTR